MASGGRQEVIAIIPARGGSKGVPRKNLKLLAGKPLIVHTIEHALATESVTRVVVSTDDPEISAVALGAGAEVVMRPADLSGDTASSESALRHVLGTLSTRERYSPDFVAFLQCTSPLREDGDLAKAIELIATEHADSLVSVVASHKFLWQVDAEGRPRSVNYDFRHRPRRQDMTPQFAENGSIYVFRPWVLDQCDNRLGGKVCLFVMKERSIVDIDTNDDFVIAEALLAQIHSV
jgi:N-acylneuraminate cytidylyltransferase